MEFALLYHFYLLRFFLLGFPRKVFNEATKYITQDNSDTGLYGRVL